MAKGQGWHKDSERHAQAAKGQKTSGTTSKTSKGSGWYGDPKGHSKAAKGEETTSGGLMDKLTGG